MKKIIAAAVLAMAAVTPAMAQTEDSGRVVVQSLFEYPMAPEELTDLADKSNWLMENFWNPMDFKQKIVNQVALNHAFSVYVAPMRWADREKVMKSVEALVSKVQKNPGLLYEFTKAAEANLYGPNADMWIDDVYLPFLRAAVKNKKLGDKRRAYFQAQLDKLNNTRLEGVPAAFDFMDRNGAQTRFTPDGGRYLILQFGDVDCIDCRMTRIKMETDPELQNMIKDDKVHVYYMFLGAEGDGWKKECEDYPHFWTVGNSDNAEEIYDIRLQPSFYLIGPDRKLLMKNVSYQQVKAALGSLMSQP